MRITWLGHSSLKLVAEGKIIYIDPYAGSPEDYVPADIVLVSHWHFSHCNLDLLRKITKDDTVVLSTRETAAEVYGVGVIREWETRVFGNVKITGVPAYQSRLRGGEVRWGRNHPKGFALGFVIKAENKTLYFAGDTDFIPEMKKIKADVLFVPVGGTATADAREALKIVQIVKPKTAVPIHYGKIYGSRDDAELFKELAEPYTIVKIFEEGETAEI